MTRRTAVADIRAGTLFVATVRRKEVVSAIPAPERGSEKITHLFAMDGSASASDIAGALGLTPRAIEKQIASLKLPGASAASGLRRAVTGSC